MNRLNAIQDRLNTRVEPYLSFLKLAPVNIVLTLMLVLYAGNFVPPIPSKLKTVFTYTPFKIFYLFLVIYLTGINAGTAAIMGLGAYVTFSKIRGENAIEAYGLN